MRIPATTAAILVPMIGTLHTQHCLANPAAPIWSGAYFGLNAGASWADVSAQSLVPLDVSRAALGGHVGYDMSFGSFVVGVEADAKHNAGSGVLNFSGGSAATFSADWSGSVRLRAGATIGPALLYATAGWGWTGASVVQGVGSGSNVTTSQLLNGVVYGVGAEAFVLPSVTVRLEFLRTDYATDGISLSGGIRTLKDLDHGDTTVRAGVSIRLK